MIHQVVRRQKIKQIDDTIADVTTTGAAAASAAAASILAAEF